VCLLAAGKPSVATEAIERVIKANPKELTKTLSNILSLGSNVAVPVLYHDGNIGHCITLLKYNAETSRFTYVDPWPETSLLCKEYNAAEIDAKCVDKQLWSITSTELEKVVFAAFVFQHFWAEYNGKKYYTTYSEFRNSDFWSFFHITEKDRLSKEDDGRQTTLIVLRTGGFQSEIKLEITLDQQQRLKEGRLKAKRSWLMGPPYGVNPFALDIVRSFIATLIPPPDQQRIDGLVAKLTNIKNPNYAKQLLMEERDNSVLQLALFTYLGAAQSCEWMLDFSGISMANSVLDDVIWLEVAIEIYLV
jgi:hypothetical protein